MTFMDRIVGVLRLDINTYEDIEADNSANIQAAIVVALVALFAAIPAFMARSFDVDMFEQVGSIVGVQVPPSVMTALNPWAAGLSAFVNVFIGWLVASALIYFIGTRLFGGQATFGEMLRVIGFAQAPRLLAVLSLGGIMPCISPLIAFAAWIWMIATNYVGIRQGLDITAGKVILTVIVSWLAAVLLNAFVIQPIFGLFG